MADLDKPQPLDWGERPDSTWSDEGEYTTYRNVVAHRTYEACSENPLEDDDGAIPMFTEGNRTCAEKTYGEYDLQDPISWASWGKVIRHQRRIIEIVDPHMWLPDGQDQSLIDKWQHWHDEMVEDADGDCLVDVKLDSLREMMSDASTDELAQVWNLLGVPALATQISFSQSSWTDALLVWHPDWAEAVGARSKDKFKSMEDQVEMFRQWGSGEVFYVTFYLPTGEDLEDHDVYSCGGFYGYDNEASGMDAIVRETVDYLIETTMGGETNWQAWCVANGVHDE